MYLKQLGKCKLTMKIRPLTYKQSSDDTEVASAGCTSYNT
jgi:hypothetical protein